MITRNQRPEISKLYIGPEETFTDVRERLKHISAPCLTLIVPRFSRLCHAIDWKLLARCAQEQGKDILVSCTDSHICALARSVHFQIVEDAVQPAVQKRAQMTQSPKREASRKSGRKAS